MRAIKYLLKKGVILAPLLEVVLFPLLVIAIVWFKVAKFIGFSRTPFTRWLIHQLGMLPVVDHYYEPFFQFKKLSAYYEEKRHLSGIDWNIEEQLAILDQFKFQSELSAFPLTRDVEHSFYHGNGSFGYTDAEFLYSFIRLMKPKRIIEVGSGFSTLMMLEALKLNSHEQEGFKLMCIEPFEMPWLDSLQIELLRKKVEEVPVSFFASLQAGDILFIDSSHVITPEGDVLYELFTILPVLNQGVIVHFHDIFTPHHYPKRWLEEEYRLWNEQYIMEAFLMHNANYKIIGGLNYLSTHYSSQFFDKFPIARANGMRPGSSMWLQKVR